MSFNKKINIYMIFAIIVTIILNITIQTEGILLWLMAFMSIFNLFFTTKRSRWFIVPDLIWIIGMVYIAFNELLYYDLVQYAYYFIIAFVQFYNWSKHSTGVQVKLRRINLKQTAIGIIFWLVAVVIMYHISVLIGGASPLLDSINTSLAFTGAFLLSRRYYEAQYVFLLSNVMAALLYFIRGVPSVTITFLLFVGFSIIAIVEWRKDIE